MHVLTNTGNVAETYTLTAANVDDGTDTLQADEFRIWKDQDENGVLNATDYDGNSAITTITLDAGESVQLIMETMFPASISATDNLIVTLQAVDSAGNEAVDMDTVSTTFTDGTVPTTPIKVWNQANGGNCHAYTWIQTPTTIHDAKTAAAKLVYGGVSGHLVSLTSDAENKFAFTKVMLRDTGDQTAWTGLEATNGTNYAWPTGEAYSFEDFNGTEGQNSAENYVAMRHGTGWFDVKDVNSDGSPRAYGYLVEFDTACAQPKVEVALTAAKDVACDGTADEAFGDVNLADMASGECAIMRGNVEVTSAIDANEILLKSAIPADADFVSGSLSFCKGENCDLTTEDSKRTDVVGDDADYKTDSREVVYWFDSMVAGAKGLLQYAIKIK